MTAHVPVKVGAAPSVDRPRLAKPAALLHTCRKLLGSSTSVYAVNLTAELLQFACCCAQTRSSVPGHKSSAGTTLAQPYQSNNKYGTSGLAKRGRGGPPPASCQRATCHVPRPAEPTTPTFWLVRLLPPQQQH